MSSQVSDYRFLNCSTLITIKNIALFRPRRRSRSICGKLSHFYSAWKPNDYDDLHGSWNKMVGPIRTITSNAVSIFELCSLMYFDCLKNDVLCKTQFFISIFEAALKESVFFFCLATSSRGFQQTGPDNAPYFWEVNWGEVVKVWSERRSIPIEYQYPIRGFLDSSSLGWTHRCVEVWLA